MILFLFFLLELSQSIQFKIPVNGFRCVTELVYEGQIVHGHFGLKKEQQLNQRTLSFKIFNQQGEILLQEELQEGNEKNKFAFTPEQEGSWDFCFIDQTEQRKAEELTIILDIKLGFQENVKYNYAKKETVEKTEYTIDECYKSSHYITEYIQECRKIEYERRDMNESINAFTLWSSIIIIIFVVVSTLWQMRSLKTFFLRRKLI